MGKRTRWKPTRDELILAFAELVVGVGGSGYPRGERELIVDLCYARRDLQLALLGYEPGPSQPMKQQYGSAVELIAPVL